MSDRLKLLKCWPSFFDAIVRGDKRFEARFNDRDYAVGDTLVLREWDPNLREEGVTDQDGFTGNCIRVMVDYAMYGGQFGLDERHCVLSIRPVSPVYRAYYESEARAWTPAPGAATEGGRE